MKNITISAISALALVAVPMASALAECPENELVKAGTISGEGGSVGLILGYRWASGTITLNDGTVYKFKAKGGKVAEVGYIETKVEGTIYNMNSINDFNGMYYGVSTGITLYKGLGGASFTNGKCVAINIKKVDATGLQGSMPAPGAVKIELVK